MASTPFRILAPPGCCDIQFEISYTFFLPLLFQILALQKNQDVQMVIVIMDLEHGLTQIKPLMLVNGKMVLKKEKELKHGQMDMYTRESLAKANGMVKEL